MKCISNVDTIFFAPLHFALILWDGDEDVAFCYGLLTQHTGQAPF